MILRLAPEHELRCWSPPASFHAACGGKVSLEKPLDCGITTSVIRTSVASGTCRATHGSSAALSSSGVSCPETGMAPLVCGDGHRRAHLCRVGGAGIVEAGSSCARAGDSGRRPGQARESGARPRRRSEHDRGRPSPGAGELRHRRHHGVRRAPARCRRPWPVSCSHAATSWGGLRLAAVEPAAAVVTPRHGAPLRRRQAPPPRGARRVRGRPLHPRRRH